MPKGSNGTDENGKRVLPEFENKGNPCGTWRKPGKLETSCTAVSDDCLAPPGANPAASCNRGMVLIPADMLYRSKLLADRVRSREWTRIRLK